MGSLALIVPVVILGGIVWAVIGVFRQRAGERFTLATAASLYAHLMTVIGLVVTLVAGGTGVKLALSLVNPAYSYYVPTAADLGKGGAALPPGAGPPANYLDIQREQDLILAIVLAVAGLLLLGGHLLLARVVRRMPGGDSGWITRGVVIAITVFTGVPGLLSAIFAAYSVLVFTLISQPGQMPFGDALGTAVVFIPAWLVSMGLLLRRLRPLRVAPAGPSGALSATS
jgi:hypothetical protein